MGSLKVHGRNLQALWKLVQNFWYEFLGFKFYFHVKQKLPQIFLWSSSYPGWVSLPGLAQVSSFWSESAPHCRCHQTLRCRCLRSMRGTARTKRIGNVWLAFKFVCLHRNPHYEQGHGTNFGLHTPSSWGTLKVLVIMNLVNGQI